MLSGLVGEKRMAPKTRTLMSDVTQKPGMFLGSVKMSLRHWTLSIAVIFTRFCGCLIMTAPDDQDRQFLGRIQSAIETVQGWEDSALLAECRAQIPLDKVNQNCTRHDDELYQGNALFLKHLTLYFKEDVMTWVNKLPCSKCGNEEMESRPTREPRTDEDRQGGASRVEVYYCTSCNDTSTFPRYNSVRKLLETRKGRCGEYANLFGLYCRAAGFETRYCADFTDHVWVECLVDGEWIMADSCEGLIDKASMYEHGWGKDLSYVIGVTTDSVVDVTPRYTRKWFSPDFQARRRAVCSSEEQGQRIVQQCNTKLQQSCSKKRCEELNQRLERERRMLSANQQATEWSDVEKHGQGRISGSLQWKLSRKEVGDLNSDQEKVVIPSVQSWHVESFYPPSDRGVIVNIFPGGILVSGAKCSVIGSNISAVVLDELYLGCILQSRGFASWKDVSDFVETIPKYRIVAIQGSADDIEGDMKGLSHLGGFSIAHGKDGLLYLGQVGALPAWVQCTSYGKNDINIEMPPPTSSTTLKLRTERETVPRRIAWRLPESIMPLQTQLLASEEQKRIAFLSFAQQQSGRSKQYVGYTTKANSPVYLLDASAYPFSHSDGDWNTFHFLPSPLVPDDDVGIVEKSSKTGAPKVDIPLETFFFTTLLGSNLLVKNSPGSAPTLIDTANALHNSRLIGLYFSAHWCGPCRNFSPILAEVYSHLKEEYPTHGLEIVFVTSDRDPAGFQQYFGSMPWMAVPFQTGGTIIPQIKARFGIRGIPALVILDAITGQIVVPASDSRREVVQACQRGDEGIEEMLDTWIARTPSESQEILTMLELSCQDNDEKAVDSVNATVHPYLTRSEESKESVQDPAILIKETFAKLASEGAEPNSAAAKAIQMVAEAQKSLPTTNPGPLSDIEWKSLDSRGTSDAASLISEMIETNKDGVQTVLTTTLKYLENAKREPWTPKFRSFKLSNKIVDRMTRVKGALDLIYSLGFYMYPTETDFMACIPLSANLNEMEASMKALLLPPQDSQEQAA